MQLCEGYKRKSSKHKGGWRRARAERGGLKRSAAFAVGRVEINQAHTLEGSPFIHLCGVGAALNPNRGQGHTFKTSTGASALESSVQSEPWPTASCSLCTPARPRFHHCILHQFHFINLFRYSYTSSGGRWQALPVRHSLIPNYIDWKCI